MSANQWRFRFVVATSLVTALTVFNLYKEEPLAMADLNVQMGWEWRAERLLEQRLGLRLIQIKEEGNGLFGIGRSPSLAGSLPDAQRVQADVIALDRPGTVKIGTKITFRIPKKELRGAHEGALVAVGIIGQNVVCFAPAPAAVSEASLASWISEAPCP